MAIPAPATGAAMNGAGCVSARSSRGQHGAGAEEQATALDEGRGHLGSGLLENAPEGDSADAHPTRGTLLIKAFLVCQAEGLQFVQLQNQGLADIQGNPQGFEALDVRSSGDMSEVLRSGHEMVESRRE